MKFYLYKLVETVESTVSDLHTPRGSAQKIGDVDVVIAEDGSILKDRQGWSEVWMRGQGG